MKRFVIFSLVLLVASGSFAADPIKVLIVDGVNNHDWKATTKANKATLEATGRFTVDIDTSPEKDAPKEEWEAWRPRFSDYDVVLSNFNDDCWEEGGCDILWSEETREDFEKFVKEGGGFVVVHGADNSFAKWDAYNEMIGMGGWGGRMAGVSGYLLRLIDGEWKRTSPNEGLSGEHAAQREFSVIHEKPNHPILKGLPTEWMHAKDELYSALRGPAENIEVLAHSHSLLTEENEPIFFLITYGKGKVFHAPMGHASEINAALHCVGFQTVLARGTEYVATGKVTIGIPDLFPTKNKAVAVPPKKVKW